MDITQLNTYHGIPNHVKFVNVEGGLQYVMVQNQSATAVIALHGGQILSYKPVTEQADLLFLSKKSIYTDGKAIRGGIPVCWPWFGPDPKGLQRPNHGFVRYHAWSVVSTASSGTQTTVCLQFFESYKKEKTWKQPFSLTLEITVGKTLGLKLCTQNTGDKPFSITQAFHTYFNVGVIGQIQIEGLAGSEYFDKLDQGTQKEQHGNVKIGEEVDRIYTDIKNPIIIHDPILQRKIHISSPGNETIVVWNPWIGAAKKFADFADDDYQHFVCVETGNIAFDLISLAPGSEHSFYTNFQIVRD